MNMSLRKIADAIGIGPYNEALDAVYESMTFTDEPAVNIALIDQLEKEWNLFREYHELVRALGIQVNSDENRSKWVKVTAKYVLDNPCAMAKNIPVPSFDGTALSMMLPLYTHLPSIPLGIADYRRRGFSDQQIADWMDCYYSAFNIVKHRTGLPGLNNIYYNWVMNFTKARIFRTDGLQFELRQVPDSVVYIKNKTSGEVLPLMNNKMIHCTGVQILGSEGYEDEEGAFQAQFREDADAFYGHACVDSKVEMAAKTFPKTQWEAYLRPGEDCLSIHIPRGTDICAQAMERYIKTAREMVKRGYPEHKGTAIFGSSWILDPKLAELLGPDSKITCLLNMFLKYPQKSNGNSVFSFVFDGKPENLEDLEETTSLHRKLKKLYLDGECIHNYAGIIVE